jgi:hypothetical protein
VGAQERRATDRHGPHAKVVSAGVDGGYRIFAAPAAGGPAREVAHSEGPTYQNFRFVFNVRGDSLYFVLADRQSDVWTAEVVGK